MIALKINAVTTIVPASFVVRIFILLFPNYNFGGLNTLRIGARPQQVSRASPPQLNQLAGLRCRRRIHIIASSDRIALIHRESQLGAILEQDFGSRAIFYPP